MEQIIAFARFFMTEFLPGNTELIVQVAAIVIGVTYAAVVIAIGVAAWKAWKEDK